MSRTVFLVRHPPVAKAWLGRCYGRSDMGLSREGQRMAAELVRKLAAEPIGLVVHSGAKRASGMATAVAMRIGCEVREDRRWWERDFGSWEGRSWNAIWRDTGDVMDRMITDPHRFRPGGGESGAALSARVQEAWRALPGDLNVLIVAHGGSLAALRSTLTGAALTDMADFIPRCGEIVKVG